ACQTHVLTMGAGGFPKMDFDQAECTFCYACAAHCPENLFLPQSVAPWDYQLSISERCLAQRQVECRCCQDACEVQAIRFRPTLNGIARPEPDVSSCTTCGACIPACPVSAITLRSRHE
ncbi:MAG TPA: ferredoxin-type protein NapF, partial [Enterobacteriaceae bacterium]|nr:ferredoxin-type protein NapF [Enterobacteriaceae bacterium]